MLRQAFTTKPIFHPLPFLLCIILKWPCGLAGIIIQLLTPVVQIYAQYHYVMHNGKRWGLGVGGCMVGGGGGGGGEEKEWQTEPGKINTDVVSSWVLMSTTHHHLGRNTNGQKEKINRKM